MNWPLWSVVCGGGTKLNTDQQKLRRYLLGDLSEAEAAQLEDSSFRSADQLEELRSVENDLIDEYARGELSPDESAEFESLFYANPERRQRVEFAMALAKVTSRLGPRAGKTDDARTGAFRNFFTSLSLVKGPAEGYAFAVLALAVLAGSWWLFTRSSGKEHTVTRQPTPQITPGAAVSAPSPAQLTRSQSPEVTGEKPAGPGSNDGRTLNGVKPQHGITRPGGTVATFILLPGLPRSGADRTRLVVPHGRQSVRLKLKLEPHDSARYRNFAAALSRAGSGTIWSLQTVSKNGTVVLNIPLSRLPAETSNYDLMLRGRTERGGDFETIGYYYLAIVRE